VADDWMMNVFGLAVIHPGISTGGVLDRTKIGKPEGTCKTQLSHPAAHKLLQVKDYKLYICNLCNSCQMHNCSETVYIIKKGVQGNWTKNHQTFPKKGNHCMKFNQLHQQQIYFVVLGMATKNM
jgi:hypothetical protein